jgi:methylase of polypeptide subunit release factors
MYRGRIDAAPPLVALIELFLFGEPVRAQMLRSSLGRGWRSLLDAGLVRVVGDVTHPVVRLTPFDGLMIASDPVCSNDVDAAHVLGVEPSSVTLSRLTIRRTGESTLDLGAGCGVQALLAAGHADKVLGVDNNPRAVRLAWLNVALNGYDDSMAFVEGDFYEPVDGRTFDLVVANLPFAIAPDVECLFEHATDPRGDDVGRVVVTAAAEHLAPGGIAHVLCSWIVRDPERWAEPVARWLEESGCDAIILRHGLEEAVAYAAARNRHLRAVDAARFASQVSHWRQAFEAASIPWIAWGAIVLRRRSGAGRHWIAAFEDVALPGTRGGAAVRAMFAGADALQARCTPEAILGQRLTVASDLRCAQVKALLHDDPSSRRHELDLDGGAGVRVQVNDLTLATVTRLAGAPSLRRAIPEEAREHSATRIALAFRELVASGFVRP